MFSPLPTRTDGYINGRYLALLTAFLLLALGWPSIAAAQEWQTTEWTVLCSSKLMRDLPPQDCDDTGGTGPAAVTRGGLEASSRWLKGLGFRGPDVERQAMRDADYIARVSEEETQGDYGNYDQHARKLYLNSSYYFAIGRGDTEQERDNDLALEMNHTGTMVHELFHAVQHSYHQGETYDDPSRDWIWEGMAEAVMVSWLAKTQPDEKMTGYPRTFDVPLDRPAEDDDVYETFYFWQKLGQLLGSTDRVAYLDHLLEQDLDAHRGLTGIHEGLKQWNPEGLYDLYPAFISQFANDEGFFGRVQKRRLQYRGQAVEETQAGTARPVAANAHRLQVAVAAGTSPQLEVSFVEDHPDLHLIVDERRLDRPGLSSSGRNTFRTSLTGQAAPHTFFVRVANVAKNPAASRDTAAYTLRYRLTPQPLCRFTANVNGAITGHFEGKATVGFDSKDGRTARATDLTLEGDGFDLKVGLRPALTVGEAGTLEGAMAVAGHGTGNDDGAFDIFGQQEDYGDFVTTQVQESHEIPWKDLPAALRDYATRLAGASVPQTPAGQARYEQQVGDVVVRGTLRGKLTQNGGKLIETLGEPGEITFEARFNAQGETFGCDYEGFPEKMEQRMSQIPGGSQMPEQMRETFDQMKEKMTEGMSEQMKKQMEEQLEQAREQMGKAKEDGR